jgi:hypothetical protein
MKKTLAALEFQVPQYPRPTKMVVGVILAVVVLLTMLGY